MASADDTPPPCPSCGGSLVIVRSVVRDNGRHRFMKCKACPPPNNRHRDLIAPPIAPAPAPGDPDYADSWHDIAGYAQLVADRLNGVER